MRIRFISFFVLIIITLFLFVLTSISALGDSFLVFFIIIIIIFGICYSGYKEIIKLLSNSSSRKYKINYFDILFTVIGCLAAYFLNIYLNQGAIIAASLVGIISACFIKKYSIAIYTGAFAGMISPAILHDFYHILLASVITGIVFAFSNRVFEGFGGKLGATAFTSWIILYLTSDIELISPVFESNSVAILFIISLAGVFLTYILQNNFKKDVVASSAVISLLGALILPVLFPESSSHLAPLLMSATFAGMSSKKRIEGYYEVFMISVFVSIIFIYSYSHLGGGGGKLGTIAFGCVLATNGLIKFIRNYLFKNTN